MQRILAAGDQRFVSVLIEMLFARHLRLITVGPDALEYGDALDQLTGQRIGSNYFRLGEVVRRDRPGAAARLRNLEG